MTVELIAFMCAKVLRSHLVVLHGGMVVGANVLRGHLGSAVGVLVHKEETAAQRWGRLSAIGLTVYLVVDREILLDDIPGFLRNHQEANTELCHDRHRLWGHRRGVGTPFKGAQRGGTEVPAWLLNRCAAFAVALLQPVHHA